MFCGMKSCNKCSKCCLLALGPTVVNHSCVVLSITCSNLAQKSTVHVCQVATVDMEIMQLVLSQLKKITTVNCQLSVEKTVSKWCELVKLYHI